jgi:hypothetical protein
LCAVVLAITTGWQIGKSELANVQLREDMHDLGARLGTRIGFSAPKSDDEYRAIVVSEAKDHGITITTEQVSITRHQEGENETITLVADYTVAIKLPGYAFPLHFITTSVRA